MRTFEVTLDVRKLVKVIIELDADEWEIEDAEAEAGDQAVQTYTEDPGVYEALGDEVMDVEVYDVQLLGE